MKKRIFKFRHTKLVCYSGYVVQAIVNNFVPLLFVYFGARYNIPLIKITFIIAFNFALQLMIDLASALFVDRIGYRSSMLLSNFLSAAGLVLLTILPDILPDAFSGILISVAVYAVGGGLLEVIINPIIESCPSHNKAAAMSILHSFYSWGCAAVILVSTLFFRFIGLEQWRLITRMWCIVPVLNMLVFPFVPLSKRLTDSQRGLSARELFSDRRFITVLLMMFSAGAAEMTISQWVSAFAETGLKVSKTVGDLAGAFFFAVLFGLSRTIYGKWGARLDLLRTMRYSTILCIAAFMLIVLSPYPALSLIGCGISGFAVGIFWPGTVSLAARSFGLGGTLMFSLLAFAGDVGCTSGPALAGAVAAAAGDQLKAGIAAAVIFPVIMAVCAARMQKSTEK